MTQKPNTPRPFSRELWTEQIAEGKTKVLLINPEDLGVVLIRSKDRLTKNDDPSQTKVMEGKAAHATTTTCAVFSLLRQAGVPVAFNEQVSETEFLAPRCEMIKLEVVARRYADGSYLKRSPNLKKGAHNPPHRFHRLVIEFFLKTTAGKIVDKGERELSINLPIDDPFITTPYEETWPLKHPKVPGWDQDSDLSRQVQRKDFLPKGVTVEKIEEITRRVFLVLESAWAQLGCRLIDFKIEFGIGPNGELLVADVIDNDSWRLRTFAWEELSKQLFRDNAAMAQIMDKYALVAGLVGRFSIPKQAVVLWRGSENDKLPVVPELAGVKTVSVVQSGHKSPAACLLALEDALAGYPGGGVILALVGKSNGLGPTLAARTSWPVISVPLTAKDRPHDAWSSLEMPSQVPNLTVLSPENAVLAALNILAQQNPAVYMFRQYDIELLDE